MAQVYTLDAIFAVLPFTYASLPLVGLFYPFTDSDCDSDSTDWLVRYVVDSKGFWLQTNDPKPEPEKEIKRPILSRHEFEVVTGYRPTQLTRATLASGDCVYGTVDGGPILAVPCSARQFFDFLTRADAAPRDFLFMDDDDANKQLAELENTNPEGAELWRLALSGELPPDDAEVAADAEVVTQQLSGVHVSRSGRSRSSVRDATFDYIVGVYQRGQFSTVRTLFLELTRGREDNSPFVKGTGNQVGMLFVPALSKPLSLKTLQNWMPDIRRAPKK